MSRPAVPSRRPALRPPSGVRTYLVLAIGSAAGAAEFTRALGTVAAPHRTLAREVARTLYPQVAAEEIRVVAAAGAPAGLIAAALAVDGAHALAG